MSRVITSINANTDTFQIWIERTNEAIAAFTDTVTVEQNAAGDTTSGNGYVIGTFGSNVGVFDTLRGGDVTTSATMNITSNASFSGDQINATSNVYILGSNVQIDSNSSVTAFKIIGGTYTNTTINGTNLIITANSRFTGTSLFNGVVTVNNNLTVNGDVSISGNVTSNLVITNSGVTVSNGNIDINSGSLTVNGDLTVTGNVTGTFDTSTISEFSSNVTFLADVTFEDLTTFNANATFVTPATFSAATFGGNTTFNANSSFTTLVTFGGNTTFNANATFNGISTFGANVVIQSGLSANGSYGTGGQVLHTSGSKAYWNAVSITVSQVSDFNPSNYALLAGGTAFTGNVYFGNTHFYARYDGTNPYIYFDTGNDYMYYERSTNTLRFTIGGTVRVLANTTGAYIGANPNTELMSLSKNYELNHGYQANLASQTIVSSGTVRPHPHTSNNNFVDIKANGAFTFTPNTTYSDRGYTMIYGVTNGTGAGAITFSGWELTDGDSYDTTSGSKFLFFVTRVAASDYCRIVKLA